MSSLDFVTPKNAKEIKEVLGNIVDIGLDFKLNYPVNKKPITNKNIERIIEPLPVDHKSINRLIKEFNKTLLPYCTNFSNPNFMGFPDSGNSTAAIAGSLIYNFLQQNLISQSFCSPSATFAEIAVIKWLREIVGYKANKVNDIWDVGGVITAGGTMSNSIALLLARENKIKNAMEKGVGNLDNCYLVVPKGIGHYSVKSSQMWIGCGNRLIEIETKNFRMDLNDLEMKLKKHRKKVMCVVAYAGDSRTMTIDNFKDIYGIVKSVDEKIWLHADACHGFSLGFSEKLKHKIKGIELFDSVSTDPHKVMFTPYVISALLVKDPQKLKTITSKSDLIMQEGFAFGQITPFLGSRSWESLKLWFVMKNLGRKKIGKLIEKRHEMAMYLEKVLRADKDFIVLNNTEINSVMFMYVKNIKKGNILKMNEVNKNIHNIMLREGKFHLHQFSIPDDGVIKRGETLYPLRFMSGNPNLSKKDIALMLAYIKEIAADAN